MSVFALIPCNIFAYWISESMLNVFKSFMPLNEKAEPKQGMATADNNRFLRQWFEVSFDKIYFNATDYINAMYTGKKWFPYNKGGEFRKWYGNNDYIVNYEHNGKELQAFKNSVIRNPNYYFRSSVTWSKISCGRIAFRFKPKGHIFDVAGTSIFVENDELQSYLLALLNTKVIQYILDATSPTINYEVGQIANLPITVSDCIKEKTNSISTQNVEISKKEWDSFETSWDFKKHPLI